MENEFEWRSVLQEYDYGDRKKAVKEMQTSNRRNSNRNLHK
jgi:hypothetical protein